MTLLHLHSLWVGPRLDYLERLCLASAKATGHDFTLWSYEPEKLQGVPPGTDLRDAADVMPRDRLLRYRDSGSVALGANLWRIELLAKGLGCWVDMDFIFLGGLRAHEGFLFGIEHADSINNAVIYAPPHSALVSDLQGLLRADRPPPWWGPRNRLKYYWWRMKKGAMGLDDFPWGTFGPGMLTYAIRKNGLFGHAQSADVFYPVRYQDAQKLYEPAHVVEAMLTDRTLAIHMWHSRLQGLRDAPPPPDSFMARMCERFGVEA